MPLFLTNDLHVMVPLEPTYQATWDASPEELRIAVETAGLVKGDGLLDLSSDQHSFDSHL